MKKKSIVREAYQEYLEGKRSLDEVLDLADSMRESLRAALPPIPEQTPEEIAVEEAEWARMRARSPAAPLREAYQRYLDGKCTLDDVLDLADRMRAASPRSGLPVGSSTDASDQE